MRVEALVVVTADLGRATRALVDDGPVTRVDDASGQGLRSGPASQVATEGIGAVSSQRPDVRRDLGQQDVAAEHATGFPAEQDDVPVGVARQQEDLEDLSAHGNQVAFDDEAGRSRTGAREIAAPRRRMQRRAALGMPWSRR